MCRGRISDGYSHDIGNMPNANPKKKKMSITMPAQPAAFVPIEIEIVKPVMLETVSLHALAGTRTLTR
jgi:hypothetical protein